MLYRALYQREGSTRAVTFHAIDLIEVADFVCLWERCAKVVIHSIEACACAALDKLTKGKR